MSLVQMTPAAMPDSPGVSTGAPPPPAVAHRNGIDITGLSMIYERRSRREVTRTHALAGVDLHVAPEEFVSIIGPSGCGKSTIIKILDGLVAPTTGEVLIGGTRVEGPSTVRATVFQAPGLMPWRTVLENVTLALEFAGIPRSEREERATRYIALVGLAEFTKHYPGELSGGMQQRVGLARALAVEPEVLLMDEPFGALDAISRALMQTELLRIWDQERKTVVFITHAIDEAVLLSDRIIVMREGGIAEEVRVPMSRPRSRDALHEDPEVRALIRRLEHGLHGAEEDKS
jgi:NitT/TauT family transport system ATP-binding protein